MRALITGITGQDGSYLAELLLDKGYEVFGIIRRSSSFNTKRIDHIYAHPKLKLIYGDLTDGAALARIVHSVDPNEIYNLAAQSHVRVSFDMPEHTADVAALGTIRLIEALFHNGVNVPFYQASSSEMFGSSPSPQSETTPFQPRSPYAAAKLHAYWTVRNWRDRGAHASNGILFNHESPRRNETFVTRKVTRAAARIGLGLQDKLFLGNLDAKRDWGFAGDYVEAMWLMLQQEKPDDYVIATGESYSVRDLLDVAFGLVDLDVLLPVEVDDLRGDASKARRVLGWAPKVNFKQLVSLMVEEDLIELKGAL